MSKRGNYFIAVYDKEDNNVMEFNSIHDCALYFNVSDKHIRDYIYSLKKLKSEFLLLKINEDQQEFNNLSKSL